MFLHLLNDSQQRAFLALAKQFVEADQTLSDEEHNLLELLWAETGQEFDAELPEGDVETLAAAFDGKQIKAAVLLELITVGHSDLEFHPDESAFIDRLARALGVEDATVKEMDAWVQRQVQLAQEVEKFWQS
jgi:tellurite resistance protein